MFFFLQAEVYSNILAECFHWLNITENKGRTPFLVQEEYFPHIEVPSRDTLVAR